METRSSFRLCECVCLVALLCVIQLSLACPVHAGNFVLSEKADSSTGLQGLVVQWHGPLAARVLLTATLMNREALREAMLSGETLGYRNRRLPSSDSLTVPVSHERGGSSRGSDAVLLVLESPGVRPFLGQVDGMLSCLSHDQR
jgi:hypothetical protein